MTTLTMSLANRWRNSGAGRWFYGRDAGEQKIISWLAAVIALTLVWLLIWKPVADWRAVANNRYQNAQSNLEWLTRNEDKARSSVTSAASGGDRRLLQVITRAAKAHSLQLNRVQPEGEGGVSVVLQDQTFNDVLTFIAQLAENNGVTVARAAIDGSGVAGRVNAQIKFQ